ncbi:MAG TPA: phosphoglycerate mutase family protein [Pyrinomonadaceae bacterium]|nr:phosphoglycerate mutase family protein [Pyrinomonadaceae bacterium]
MHETTAPPTRLRTIIVFSMLFALLGAVMVFAYFATFKRPVTTIILVRHGEKNIEPNNPDPDLSPAGQARAQELVRVLGSTNIDAIYATNLKRTQQTVKPIADKIGKTLTVLDAKATADLVNRIVTANRGQTVLVAGHSNTVPAIVAALGGGSSPDIPDSEYDNLFIVTIYKYGSAKVVKLKFGSAVPAATGSPMMK